MYSENVTISYGIGLHSSSLGAFAIHFPPGIAYINGIDVTNRANLSALADQKNIEISANSGDSATDKNIVDIIHGVANLGHDPWLGKGVLPAQLYQQAADYVRSHPEFGLQGSMETPDSGQVSGEMTTQASMIKEAPGKEHMKGVSPKRNRQYEHIKEQLMESGKDEERAKEEAARTVNKQRAEHGETKSSKLSMWNVVALGELQQPSGVGATQQYNPILDGPNPDGPNFQDNAQNSQEQEQALQTWVNHALNMLEQGDDPEVVVAKLAHDGCPEPEAVLKMAMERPEKGEVDEPITDQIGQDPFEAPMPDGQTADQQDVFRQPPVVQAKRVRIAGTSLTGVELDRWEDLWGQGQVKIALDDGGTMSVAPDAVETVEADTPEHPVTQIQDFIDNLPKVEPTRPSIEAHIANLELVRRAVRSNISKVGFSDQVKLQQMDTDAQSAILALKESLGATISESDVAYLSGQQTYRPHGLELPGVERVAVVDSDFSKKMREKARIFVSELTTDVVVDADSVAYAAAHYASAHNVDINKFLARVEVERLERLGDMYFAYKPAEEPVVVDHDGPAEGIYL